jgi:DNA-binding MarR family transcriptional regulator
MDTPRRPERTGFLLSQLGSFAAARFAELVKPAGLTPATAGALRILARNPGLSQRALADRLGAVPSRVVVLVDALENAGLVSRTRDPDDRRHHRLDLTDAGRAALQGLRAAAEQQREAFAALISRLASAHGIDPDVHRGFGDHPHAR